MLCGKVIGNVVSTQKHAKLTGCKLLIVELPPEYAAGGARMIVAVDELGAGRGEEVLLALGSAARMACGDEWIPVDATIVGIIDRYENSW